MLEKSFPISAVSCSAPEHPINGRAIFTSATFNSLVTYECDYGYIIVGRLLKDLKKHTTISVYERGIMDYLL